jgi:ferric-chelate reductase
VHGPFGVVSAVEFIGIILFIVYVVYSMTYYAVETVSLISEFHVPASFERYVL